jgi:plastocyanin
MERTMTMAVARFAGALLLIAMLVLVLSGGAATATARTAGGARAAVTGRVTFTGAAPAAQAIDMSSEAMCHDARRNAPAMRRSVRVDPQNALADVIVQIRGLPGNLSKPVPSEPVVLDQKACMYEPAVLVLRVGQPLVVRNSDHVLHNVHVSPKLNPSFNLGQPMAGMESRRVFRAAEIGIPVRCDIHDWMSASIGVLDHSFFAVTGEDGRFTFDGLPAGEYDLVAWHPTLGTRTQKIRVSDTGTSDVAIVFGGT